MLVQLKLTNHASNPKTPLDYERLEDILGGMASVGGDGVVTVDVSRKEQITLGGVPVKSDLGILTTVAFEPLSNASNCAVAPDFAMLGSEVGPVFRVVRKYGFSINCLYNQETDEKPQFYFSHCLVTGDAYVRASQIREALNHTNSDFKS